MFHNTKLIQIEILFAQQQFFTYLKCDHEELDKESVKHIVKNAVKDNLTKLLFKHHPFVNN